MVNIIDSTVVVTPPKTYLNITLLESVAYLRDTYSTYIKQRRARTQRNLKYLVLIIPYLR